ncbi:MAG: hypothetical protein JSU69_02855 [Candidatus Zixiibacteriota bacterium]|nr:MAG: hypothetical protein JSU69_02855 [candidate division Zixibacteria bacterium]
MKLPIILILLLVLTASAGGYEFGLGRQSGMAGCIMLSSPTASDMLTCPTANFRNKEVRLEAGYQRKYELSDLDRVFVSGCYRYRGFSGAIGFSQFGRSDYYVEQMVKTALSYNHNLFTVSAMISGKMLEIGSGDRRYSLGTAALGLGGAVSYRKYHLGLVLDNLNGPKLADNDEADNAVYSIYGEIEGPARFSITGRVTLEKKEKPSLAIGQYIRLHDQGAIFWGLSDNPLAYGGGLEINYKNLDLMYAVSYHPVLGFTHNISLGFASGNMLH